MKNLFILTLAFFFNSGLALAANPVCYFMSDEIISEIGDPESFWNTELLQNSSCIPREALDGNSSVISFELGKEVGRGGYRYAVGQCLKTSTKVSCSILMRN